MILRPVRSRVAVVLLALAACSGSGSDIGPSFVDLPDASSKVNVLDDQGRGVVGATATLVDAGRTAVTGRNGRGDFFAEPRGRLRVRVDGATGAAVAGDRLARLDLALQVDGDLPAAIHLPDLPDAASAAIASGTQTATTAITSGAGAVLTVAAGSSVGLPDAAATGTLRLGDLAAPHLPGDLPTAAPGRARLFTRGVFVDPPGATFAPGAVLDVLDELSLPPTATATLHRLDPDTGEWTEIANGIAASGGRLAAALTAGGLHAFSADVPAATVTGRLRAVDLAVLPDQLVNVDGRWTRTDGGGRFTIGGIPAELADGSARSAAAEFVAGGSWLPARAVASIAVGAGATADLGDVTFDTVTAVNLRVQQIRRGRAETRRRVSVGTSRYPVAVATASDGQGQALIEDLPTLWFGFQDGFPRDVENSYYAQSLGFVDEGRRWQDAYMFFDELSWFIGSRSSRVLITDRVGHGPIEGAAVVRGPTALEGFTDIVDESGTLFGNRPFDGRITATNRSERDGATYVDAVTIERPNGEHLELPLQRAYRRSLGAFDRHGLVAGTLTGVDPARQHELRATRWIELQEWWDDVVDGVPLASSLPKDVDPAVTHGDFRVGVDARGGHVAAAELTVAGAVRTLQKLGLATALAVPEGAVTALDVALDRVATASFALPGALAGLDPAIPAADLRLDLALELSNGTVVDCVRDLGGNHAAAGSDLVCTLPALTGSLAGHRWRVLLRGAATQGGATIEQRTLNALRGDAGDAGVAMLAPPTLLAPAAGATVPATGFVVQFELPAGCMFARLDVVSVQGGEQLAWRVYIPPEATSFEFVQLPPEAASPLVAGRSYSLTLSAYRADTGRLTVSDDAFRDVTTFLQSVGPAEFDCVAVSSRSITVTTN